MKPMTIFSDIDGTLVHQVRFEEINPHTSRALPGAVEKMNKWYNEGHHIVLTTARPEYLRNTTEIEMKNLGIPFHQFLRLCWWQSRKGIHTTAWSSIRWRLCCTR